MNNMKELLMRSYWGSLVVGVCDIDSDRDLWKNISDSGWETGLDGGGNVHSPSEWGVIFAKAGMFEERGIQEVWMLRTHERFSQNHNDTSWQRVFRHRNPASLGEDIPTWEDQFWNGPLDYNNENWERVDDPPEDVFGVLERAQARLVALHGQGNWDELFGENPPALVGGDFAEVVIVPRASALCDDEDYESEV
jgi:hypothetical protein